jgi:hypothetical protein
MSKQLAYQRSVVIRRPIGEVAAYLGDFARAHEWRAGVVETSVTPAGPVQPGSVLREVSLVVGRQIVTESVVTSSTVEHGFAFSHLGGPLPVSGQYTCVEQPDGTLVTAQVSLTLTGNWVMFAEHLRRAGVRMMTLSLLALRYVVESAPDRQPALV